VHKVFRAFLVALLLILPTWAYVGLPVYDAKSDINALLQLAEIIKTYLLEKAQLELQVLMSKTVPVDMPSRYRTTSSSWYDLQLPYDRFENLSGWAQAVNKGGDARTGYAAATVLLRQYGSSFQKLAFEEQAKVSSLYGSAELVDATNIHSMETIGQLRSHAASVEKSIQALEDDSLSLDPSMNTVVGVLNKINAASIASLRGSRDTNRTLLSVLEHQVAESKLRRDGYVSEINAEITRQERGAEVNAQHTATISQSIRGFRWR